MPSSSKSSYVHLIFVIYDDDDDDDDDAVAFHRSHHNLNKARETPAIARARAQTADKCSTSARCADIQFTVHVRVIVGGIQASFVLSKALSSG